MSEAAPIVRPNPPILEPGTLWSRVVDRTQHALQCGALLSIPTEQEFIEQGEIRFLVRILTNLTRKDVARRQQDEAQTTGKPVNPFLPYEADLFVADISPTHLCLLNKFNVVNHHLLLITRDFEAQETWLTQQDFEAMWQCLAEFDGLVFYNAGKDAGASQPHKHLQLISLTAAGAAVPIAPLLSTAEFCGVVGTLPGLPFVHAFTRFDWTLASPATAALKTLERYRTLLDTVNLRIDPALGNYQSGAYNLLATREWMLIVPRSQEAFATIPVNSLGFAGTLLVRNAEQMQILKEKGPLNILSQVGFPRRVNCEL
jgi:sulfate adenylyltransferase (ADP) / ATP adenylyltransferase